MSRLLLIARREYLSYVATWGFWVSLAMVPVFMLVGFSLPVLLERASPVRAFTVIADEPRLVEAIDAELERRRREALSEVLAGLVESQAGPEAGEAYREAVDAGADPREAALQAGAPQMMVDQMEAGLRREYVRVDAPGRTPEALRPYLTGERLLDGERPLSAAIIVEPDPDGGYQVDYWSANLTNPALLGVSSRAIGAVMRDDALREAGIDPALVRTAESHRPLLRELSPEKEEGAEEVTLADRLPLIMGVGAGFVLWSVIFSVANMLLTSTIEEKSNKVLEVLLSSARLPEILAGKLLGVAGVSFTLLAVWLTAGAGVLVFLTVAAAAGGPAQDILQGLVRPGLLIPFLFYFAVGYLIYGAIFMAIGSLCETIQEAQTLMSPLIIVLMAPMIFLTFSISNLDSPIVGVASWFPLFTPFLMIARLAQDPPLWEILGTALLMLATLAGVIWAASTVFRAGALGQAKPHAIWAAFRRS